MVSFHYPSKPTNPQTPQIPTNKDPHTKQFPLTQAALPNATQQPNSKDWAPLFHTQGPSKVMKLYPKLQQENNVVVELDESNLNDKTWSYCLIGFFWMGRCHYPYLALQLGKYGRTMAKSTLSRFEFVFFFEF